MKLAIFILALLAAGNLAQAQVSSQAAAGISAKEALRAVQATAEVKALYATYMKNHYNGHLCDGCATVGKEAVAKEELPKTKLNECQAVTSVPGFFTCEVEVTKYIFTNDNYVQEMIINAHVEKQKGDVSVELRNITFQKELND